LLDIYRFINWKVVNSYRDTINKTVGLVNQRSPVQTPWRAEFFLSEIYTSTPNVVSVQSVKNGKSHKLIDGISVAVNSAKGEIRVSENRTLGLRRWVTLQPITAQYKAMFTVTLQPINTQYKAIFTVTLQPINTQYKAMFTVTLQPINTQYKAIFTMTLQPIIAQYKALLHDPPS
jgi:hypothetical protein